MDERWTQRLLKLRFRETESDFLEFCELVDMAQNRCDLETCRTLTSTFVIEDDFGSQESVCRVLASANDRDRQIALLEQLERIRKETPEWADCLIEQELRFHRASLNKTLETIDPELRAIWTNAVAESALTEQFPELK